MHINKAKNQSWSGIPFDRTLYHCRQDLDDVWLALSCEAFAVLHTELLQAIFEILLMRYEDAIALLLYLKTKEELQLPHHGHLILLLRHVSKLVTVSFVSAAIGDISRSMTRLEI